MKHTYKSYYFLLVSFFLLEIPQHAFATHIFGGEIVAEVISCHSYTNAQDFIDPDKPDPVLAVHAQVEKPKVGVYPNPTSGPITLEVKDDLWQGGTASIYNILGQLIVQKPVDDDEIDFDLSDQSQGVYFVTLRKGDMQKTLRIVRK